MPQTKTGNLKLETGNCSAKFRTFKCATQAVMPNAPKTGS